MRLPHKYLVELGDLSALPKSLRETVYETLEITHSHFSSYNVWVANRALALIECHKITTVYELGCGEAPLTRLLVGDKRTADITLIPCDLRPHVESLTSLAEEYPRQVQPNLNSFDYSKPDNIKAGSLAILSTTFHHLDETGRQQTLQALTSAGAKVLIAEPLRNTLLSVLYCCMGFIPGLALPIIKWRQPGQLRRIFWSWILPLSPLIYAFDGIMSSLREPDLQEWESIHASLPARNFQLQTGLKGRLWQYALFCD